MHIYTQISSFCVLLRTLSQPHLFGYEMSQVVGGIALVSVLMLVILGYLNPIVITHQAILYAHVEGCFLSESIEWH